MQTEGDETVKYSNLASRLPLMADDNCADNWVWLDTLLLVVTFFHSLLDGYQAVVMGLLDGLVALRDALCPSAN
jgi:hypothetical protein